MATQSRPVDICWSHCPTPSVPAVTRTRATMWLSKLAPPNESPLVVSRHWPQTFPGEQLQPFFSACAAKLQLIKALVVPSGPTPQSLTTSDPQNAFTVTLVPFTCWQTGCAVSLVVVVVGAATDTFVRWIIFPMTSKYSMYVLPATVLPVNTEPKPSVVAACATRWPYGGDKKE